MTPEEKKRQIDGMTILKILSDETSVIQKPVVPSSASNIPSNVSNDILNVLRAHRNHEVYGSLAMGSRSFVTRKPNDIDIVVHNPKMVASIIAHKMNVRGHKVNIKSNQEYNSHVVQIKKGGEWEDAVDIHPIGEHTKKFDVYGGSVEPTIVGGIKVQVARDQLFRKANSVMAINEKTGEFGAAPHRRQKDVKDFVSTSRLLIDSKQLQAEAELAKVKKARTSLKSWERHAEKVGAGKTKDPIPEAQEQRFIRHALKNPGIDTETLTFRNKHSFNKQLSNGVGLCIGSQKRDRFKTPTIRNVWEGII